MKSPELHLPRAGGDTSSFTSFQARGRTRHQRPPAMGRKRGCSPVGGRDSPSHPRCLQTDPQATLGLPEPLMCFPMKPIQLPTHKTFWNILNSSKDLSAHRAWALALGSSQIPSSRVKVGGKAAGATVTLSSESPEVGPHSTVHALRGHSANCQQRITKRQKILF